MDTVVVNKYNEIFSNLNIEVSKKIEGEYTVEEIISTFCNYFFNKMFLDITAIKDYKDLSNLQKLAMSLNIDKIILFLDPEDQISDSTTFLSKLVSMGIYNFTKDKNNLMYLYENPNDYGDVAYLQSLEEEKENSQSISQGISQKILGIENITDNAGSTTLIYLLKKVLSDYYSVKAIEIGKRDFAYFNDKDMHSISEFELKQTIEKYNNTDIFLIDLNNSSGKDICDDILYLIEPSTIKLNKLILINGNIFNNLKGKKIILNKVKLTPSDIATFEVESGIKVFYSLPSLNDKEDNSSILLPLLEKLGYVKEASSNEEQKNSFFKFFK